MSEDQKDSDELASDINPYDAPSRIDKADKIIHSAERRTYPRSFWLAWIVLNVIALIAVVVVKRYFNFSLTVIVLTPIAAFGFIRSAIFSYRQYHSQLSDVQIRCPTARVPLHFIASLAVAFLISCASMVTFFATCLTGGFFAVTSMDGNNIGGTTVLIISFIAMFIAMAFMLRLSVAGPKVL